MDLHSCQLSHQIDFSSRVSLSKFDEIKDEFVPTLDVYLMIDFGGRYDIRVLGKKIPKWFNHQSIGSSVLFWVDPEFPTLALCVVFHLVPLKDSYANNDSYGSICDDIIDLICDNGHKQPFFKSAFFQYLKCDHLWFCGEPHSQLQRTYGDLMQGDWNHVEISSKISHWTSKFRKFAPIIMRMGVHVECICSPKNSVIIQENSQNVDDFEDTMLTPFLPPWFTSNGSSMNLGCLSGLRHRRP